MTPRQDPPEAGTLGEEVLHLFADLAAARRARDGADAGDEGGSRAHATTCTWCPVCQAVDLVRDASPQVLQHVGDSLDSLAAAVRELSAHLARERAGGPTDPTGPRRDADGAAAPHGRPAAGVQPIDLAEDGPWH